MKQILNFLIFSILFSSCTLLFHPKTNVQLSNQQSGSKITIYSSGSSPKELTNTSSVTLESSNRYYLVTQEKEGFMTQYNVIIPTKFNYWRAVDGIGGGILAVLGINNMINGGEFGGQMFVAGVLWFDGCLIPVKLYDNKFSFPDMTPIFKRKEDQRYLHVQQVSLDVEKSNLMVNLYKNWKKFEKGSTTAQATYDEKINVGNTIFTDALNYVLYTTNFIDTNDKLIKNNYNSYYLKASIKKIKIDKVYYSIQRITMATDWELVDYVTKNTVETFRTETTSDFFPSDDEYLKDGAANCMEKALFKLMDNEKFVTKMKVEDINAVIDKWDAIDIVNTGENANSLSEVVGSSITIKVTNGHGSGVVISKNGYALTNHHVVGGENEVEVILNDKSKVKAKVIRSNPMYDLALIKIEKEDFKPIKIDLTKRVDLTTEVIAVGTPKDIDLGQTITKGIVSGFRDNTDFELIQTDAKISPGNSGGALIDKSNNSLVGVVNAKIIGFGVEGIGFAIPVEYIQKALKITIK